MYRNTIVDHELLADAKTLRNSGVDDYLWSVDDRHTSRIGKFWDGSFETYLLYLFSRRLISAICVAEIIRTASAANVDPQPKH
jgi:hypothetical protein